MNIDGKFTILGSVLRIGVNNEYDNWSTGGIITIIDPKTGKIISDASDKKGHIYKKHPITNQKFKGEQISKWKEIVKVLNHTCKVLKEASTVVENMPYIGWDVAITKNGDIELIEGNHDHDVCVFQSAYALLEDKGIGNVIKPYLK